MPSKKGKVFLLIGPTAVGKNTLLKKVADSLGNIVRMPSATDRKIRPDEINGKDKFFYSEKEFDELIDNDSLLEWQYIHGNRYGVVKKVIEDRVNAGKDYLADIEVLGSLKLRQLYSDSIFLIFIIPPHFEDLEKRILARGSETEETVKKRMKRSRRELAYIAKGDLILLNDDLELAAENLKKIIKALREKQDYQQFIEKNFEISSRAVIINENDTEFALNKQCQLFEGVVEKNQFSHDCLISTLNDLLGKDQYEIIEKDKDDPDNKGLVSIPQPLWVSFVPGEKNKIKIIFYYLIKAASDKSLEWLDLKDFWAKADEIFPMDAKRIREEIDYFIGK